MSIPQDQPELLERPLRPLPDEGELSDWSVAELLHTLLAARKSGILGLHQELIEKRIYVLDGRPVYVDSDLRTETLGAYLCRTGRLTEEDHLRLVAEMQRTSKRQGELLIEAGVLGPHELFQVLTAHMAEKIVSCVAWEEGSFTFFDADSFSKNVVTFPMETARIVIDGVMRHYDVLRIAMELVLPDHAKPFLREGSLYDERALKLSTREARLVSLVKQRWPLKQLVDEAGADIGDAVKLLYALYLLQVVGFDLTRALEVPVPTVAPEEEPRPAAPAQSSPAPEPASARPRPPAAAADSGTASTDRDRSDEVLGDYLKLKDADYFVLLGLERRAPKAAVARAFSVAKRRYGPEGQKGLSPLATEKAKELLARSEEAHAALLDDGSRRKYEAELDRALEALREEPRKLESEGAFQEALAALDKDETKKAIAKLEAALAQKPGEPCYEAWLGWAKYCANPERDRSAAEEHLVRARTAQPDLPEPYRFMARICELEGQDGRAYELYRMASSKSPGDGNLATEVHLFKVRRRRLGKGKPEPSKPEAASAINQDLGTLFRKLIGK